MNAPTIEITYFWLSFITTPFFKSVWSKINIMVVKGKAAELFDKIPKPDEKLLSEFAKYALEQAMVVVKQYPSQLQDFVIVDFMQQFIGNSVALMVLYELYENGTFRPLTKQEKVTTNLLMFADKLPE